MKSEGPAYCEHFEYLKASESLSADREAACQYCFQGGNLWLCLSKGCGVTVCARNNYEHQLSHLEESRKNKKFHSIFINASSAEIRCAQCSIQIGDLDAQFTCDARPNNFRFKGKQDPFPLRLKLLPALNDLTTRHITGQLENSEGHRRISKGLVGIFSDKYSHTINAALQFLSHCRLIRELLLQLRISEKSKQLVSLCSVLLAMQQLVKGIEGAEFRAIHSDTICQLLYKEMPGMLGYRRKDPFEVIIHLLGLINDQTLFYSSVGDEHDEWDLFYRRGALTPHYIIYDAIEATLSLNYRCPKCDAASSVPHNIQFLKLNIPKKKRKTRDVEKELASHRCTSPTKQRRKSLINFFKEEECPLTVPELIIELMKSPLHKNLDCQACAVPLKKTKLHFQRLPDILMIQIARMSKDKPEIDDTMVQLSTQSLDMGSFTAIPDEEVIYDFDCAICIEKKCLFPVVVIGQANKQSYVIRGQIVELCKEKMNPYILCYRKRPSETARQKLAMVKDDIESKREKQCQLPDFWYLQLQNGLERPFRNQLVCKHNALKPGIQSKMQSSAFVSADVYEDLAHFYQNHKQEGISPLSKRSQLALKEVRYPYFNQPCEMCQDQLEQLSIRRKKEKEYVMMYDKLRADNLPYCMVASAWIKKWSNYLYNHSGFAYMPKGYPLPPSIDNKSLLEGNKCKSNLIRNEDFKILNIYLWKFLKELYGGGPEIRYKWKEGRENLDEEMLADIREKAMELKYIFSVAYLESPKKLGTSVSFIEQSSSMMGESWRDSLVQPQMEMGNK